jgi:hypothetical protein
VALTEVYVDPSIAADSGTGTIGDPYGDIEYAIEQTTFDTTNGTRVNVKAGTAEVLAAQLDTALSDTVTAPAWAPANNKVAWFEGYTAAAGDGGVASIDCNASQFISTAKTGFVFKNLSLTNVAGVNAIKVVTYLWVTDCYIDCNNAVTNEVISSNVFRGYCSNLYIDNFNGTIGINVAGPVSNCYIYCSGGVAYAIQPSGNSHPVENNIIVMDSTGIGINEVYGARIVHNSIYHTNAGTGTGILGSIYGEVANNLVEGFSGVGGEGIALVSAGVTVPIGNYSGNAVYNCTTPYDFSTRLAVLEQDNEILTASPFNDAANGDFSPVDIGNIREGALPNIIGGGFV